MSGTGSAAAMVDGDMSSSTASGTLGVLSTLVRQAPVNRVVTASGVVTVEGGASTCPWIDGAQSEHPERINYCIFCAVQLPYATVVAS